MLRLTLAALHLIALGIGLGAVWARGNALSSPLDLPAMRRAFRADTWWGLAAALWIATGLWRLFGSTEKSTAYYMRNHIFFAKMGFLVLILLLEIWPMITLIRWRQIAGRGTSAWNPNPAAARRIAKISYAEAVLIICMVFAAVAMARGYGETGN
jgi:putative membrane protein